MEFSGLQYRAIEYDTKCPDGFTCYGWRRINKGGYVRFAYERHYHPDLIAHVGLFIYVTLRDMYGINVDVWPDGPHHKSCLMTYNQRDWDEYKKGGV